MALPTDNDWAPIEEVLGVAPVEDHDGCRLTVVRPNGTFRDPEARIYVSLPDGTVFYLGGRLRPDGPLSLVMHQPQRWELPDATPTSCELGAMLALLTETVGLGSRWLVDSDICYSRVLKNTGFTHKRDQKQQTTGSKWLGEMTPKPNFWDRIADPDLIVNLESHLRDVRVEQNGLAVKMRVTPDRPKTAIERLVIPPHMLDTIIAMARKTGVNTVVKVSLKCWPDFRAHLGEIPSNLPFLIELT